MEVYMTREKLLALDAEGVKKLVDKKLPYGSYSLLKDYYEGRHAILRQMRNDKTLPNNKLVANSAEYITDTAIGYFIGKPVVYTSEIEGFQPALQAVFDYNDEQDENMELAKMTSIYGHAFEILYMDSDGCIRFAELDPSGVIMIYENRLDMLPIGAVRAVRDSEKKSSSIKSLELYTETDVTTYDVSKYGRASFREQRPHYFGGVPIIEYKNNNERIGDFAGVISLIDAYNKAQSNTANMFQYNDEAILKLINMGGADTEDIRDMKEKGAITLEEGGDVEWLLKTLDDTAMENFKTRLKKDIHALSKVPDLTDENFSSNLSGIAILYKLWGMEQLTAVKERKFKRALQRRIELITNILNIRGHNFKYTDMDMKFRRNLPQNLLEIAQIVTYLRDFLSDETLMSIIPFVEDIASEMIKRAKEQSDINDSFSTLPKRFSTPTETAEDTG